jgi:hypothetical protein
MQESYVPAPRGFNQVFDLPRMLRSIGAISLLAAISIFLLQGWESGNDVNRYLLLLGHTVGLAIIGFASGHWLGESKGARLLLIIALASVPANFAILGAFMYEQASLDAVNAVYPSVAHWKVNALSTAVMANVGGVLILAPVVWLGFMVLSRRSAALDGFIYVNQCGLVDSRAYTGVYSLAIICVDCVGGETVN